MALVEGANENIEEQEIEAIEEVEEVNKGGKRFFDKWAEKFKEFLDNAE